MRWPFSTRSRRSCISTRSTWTSAGSSRATTRSARAAPARTTSTARWTRTQYEAFVQALIDGGKTEFKQWEGTPYFDGCLPIEVMAERGAETLRHGPMKPMGLTNAHNPDVKAYAVVQLRQDNALGTLYNMVGFQTKLKHGEQVRDLPHDPWAGERGIRAARRPAPQHLHQLAHPARRFAAAEKPQRGCASPARSRDARAMSRAPRSGFSRAVSQPPSGWARRSACRRPRPRSAHCSATSRAATSSPTTSRASVPSSR